MMMMREDGEGIRARLDHRPGLLLVGNAPRTALRPMVMREDGEWSDP